jgi:ribose transport system permease protein
MNRTTQVTTEQDANGAPSPPAVTGAAPPLTLSSGAGTKSIGDRIRAILKQGGSTWTFGVLVLLLIAFWIMNHDFFSQANWIATTTYATEYILVAVGETFVIITGGLDLSVGGILALSGMTAAWIMSTGTVSSLPVGFVVLIGALVGMGTGVLVGLVNGVIVTRLKIAPFIVTLGTLGITTGLVELAHAGQPIVGIPSPLTTFGIENLGGWIPQTVLATGIVAGIAGVVLAKTRFGLRTYGIGSNVEAARRHGVNVRRHVLKVYVISGLFAGIAGIVVLSRFGEASPLAGQNDNLNGIAAAVIGGASLFGGVGTIFGTVVGAFVLSVLVTGLVIANIQPFWQPVAVGVVLIVAVFLDQLRKRIADRS